MSMQEMLDEISSLQKSMAADAEAETVRADAEAEAAAAEAEAAAAIAAAAGAADGSDAAAAAAAAEAEAAAVAAEAGEGGEIVVVGADASLPAGMAKSFTLALEDGSEVEAVDGTEMIKSFVARMDNVEATAEQAIAGLSGVVKAQAQMMKAMSTQLERLAGEGRGRKATVAMPAAVAPLAKSQAAEQTESRDGVMAKCLAAQRTGRLTGMQVSRANIALENGYPLPEDVAAGLV